MSEAFTVSTLIDALREYEKNGWGDTIIVDSEGISFCEFNVENQCDGEVVVIQ